MRSFIILMVALYGITAHAASIGTSSGTVLSGTYSLTQNLFDGYIVYDGSSGGQSASGAISVGSLDSTGGQAVSYSYQLPIDLGSGPVAFLGMNASGSVTLSVNDATAPSYLGQTWPYGETEASIANDLKTGDPSALVSFLNAHQGDFFYEPNTTQATFIAFSSGSALGSMSMTEPAPEPSSLACLVLGLVILRRSIGKRRQTQSAVEDASLQTTRYF